VNDATEIISVASADRGQKTSYPMEQVSGAPAPIADKDPPESTSVPIGTDVTEPDSASATGTDGGVVVPFQPKPKRGRPKKTGDTYRVSVEKVSLNTYAVRIRWKREDGTDDPGVVVNRLTDDIVKEIKRSKKRYEQFKAQTLISWKSGAIRQGNIP
jgi:hypothetical protein